MQNTRKLIEFKHTKKVIEKRVPKIAEQFQKRICQTKKKSLQNYDFFSGETYLFPSRIYLSQPINSTSRIFNRCDAFDVQARRNTSFKTMKRFANSANVECTSSNNRNIEMTNIRRNASTTQTPISVYWRIQFTRITKYINRMITAKVKLFFAATHTRIRS